MSVSFTQTSCKKQGYFSCLNKNVNKFIKLKLNLNSFHTLYLYLICASPTTMLISISPSCHLSQSCYVLRRLIKARILFISEQENSIYKKLKFNTNSSNILHQNPTYIQQQCLWSFPPCCGFSILCFYLILSELVYFSQKKKLSLIFFFKITSYFYIFLMISMRRYDLIIIFS